MGYVLCHGRSIIVVVVLLKLSTWHGEVPLCGSQSMRRQWCCFSWWHQSLSIYLPGMVRPHTMIVKVWGGSDVVVLDGSSLYLSTWHGEAPHCGSQSMRRQWCCCPWWHQSLSIYLPGMVRPHTVVVKVWGGSDVVVLDGTSLHAQCRAAVWNIYQH